MGIFRDYAPLDDTSNRLAIPSLIFTILTPLFVIARLVCGKIRTDRLWLDDYLLLIAGIMANPGTALMVVASSWGLRKHEHDLLAYPPEKLPFGSGETLIDQTLKLFFVDQILYQVIMGLFKMAVLVWYTRIFETDDKKEFRMVCWGFTAAIAAFTIASIFGTIFQCDPINVAWHAQPADCFNLQAYWEARAWFNVITYFIVTFLPMLLIVGIPGYIDGIHNTKTRNALLCALFGVGIFVCFAAILRMRSIGLAALLRDRTWNSIDFIMWSIIEDNVGLICACLPAIAKPTESLVKRMMGYTRANSRSGSRLFLLPPWLHREEPVLQKLLVDGVVLIF